MNESNLGHQNILFIYKQLIRVRLNVSLLCVQLELVTLFLQYEVHILKLLNNRDAF